MKSAGNCGVAHFRARQTPPDKLFNYTSTHQDAGSSTIISALQSAGAISMSPRSVDWRRTLSVGHLKTSPDS